MSRNSIPKTLVTKHHTMKIPKVISIAILIIISILITPKIYSSLFQQTSNRSDTGTYYATGPYQGTVIDAITQEPLENVTVTLKVESKIKEKKPFYYTGPQDYKSRSEETRTNHEGVFTFEEKTDHPTKTKEEFLKFKLENYLYESYNLDSNQELTIQLIPVVNSLDICTKITSETIKDKCIGENASHIAEKNNNSDICLLSNNTNTCYTKIAVNNNDISICKLVDDTYIEEICISKVAVKNKNQKICDSITNEYLRGQCRKNSE